MSLNLQITAHLSTSFVASNPWCPSLDNLLIWLLLDQHNRLTARPTSELAAKNQTFIEDNLPLETGILSYPDWFEGVTKTEWYHKVSSPHYISQGKTTQETTRRWDKQEQHLNWQGKPAKWNSQGFHTRSMLHRWSLEIVSRIDWFCVGDLDGISALLTNCHSLGKFGKGEVAQWEINEIESNLHLYGSDGRLMRPIPKDCLRLGYSYPAKTINWGWRSPVNLPENITECVMPNNIKQWS